ncbi:MAG: selenocysteine-specific translation elongation factor, partial [SAR202 cluster bacterium]|nr:selenocysteine-specific translation elongation factor [SAR202 cluster bacterium]
MYVIGTAGHVDHGKSTLVEKLTGIDPDRLLEEKERGMTIDLGFAWLPLRDGNEISIVDVPGHERFVNNMLAGVGGIDMALLVVAADESVMPQTREHLAILDLLQVKRGLVAVTKRDLVEDDWLDLVSVEIEDLLEGTTLEGSLVMPVSGATGDGLPELITAIQQRLDEVESRKDLGRPRLPIDRAFTISGFGTVVTGTLMDGVLKVGQEVVLEPTGRKSRIRGLQSHKNKMDRVSPGTRVAANLAGVSHEDVARGEVLTTSGWLESSTAIDVRLKVLADAPRPVRHNMFVTVHVGSSEIVARVRLLEKDLAYPGDSTWAQLKLGRPGAIVKGDFFVIRSNNSTLGGGHVVEPHAQRHRRNHRPILDRLEVMGQGTDRDIIVKSIEASEPSVFDDLVKRA